ncbi:MAG TPA: chalcone isomerase family protein [Rhodoferax sp.]|jgi:hypothetical protein|nr:chalcone isomerase family protein [Rhodoferax sp.]HNV58047.1 chalcone isomerase family protein [Rhodoferax sp.]HPW28338.1 chalcone isomerase family protein [Rhodoferax sp.]
MNTLEKPARRTLLTAGAAAMLCGTGLGVMHHATAQEAVSAQPPKPRTPPLPPYLTSALPDAQWSGAARMRFFAFDVYDAALWVAPGFRASRYAQSALVLELSYLRSLKGQAIAERSIDEMRRSATLSAVQERNWLTAMRAAFPDVQTGDRITGVHQPTTGAQFWFNGQLRANVADPEFSRLFFGIWLAETTSEPRLRSALLAGAAA